MEAVMVLPTTRKENTHEYPLSLYNILYVSSSLSLHPPPVQQLRGLLLDQWIPGCGEEGPPQGGLLQSQCRLSGGPGHRRGPHNHQPHHHGLHQGRRLPGQELICDEDLSCYE